MADNQSRPGFTRRNFIDLVGKAGGVAAAYNAMAVLGLLEIPSAYAGPPQLAPGSGAHKKVLILGAGIAGMTAAYELTKAGYECTILEARNRAGGRNWTLRGGDTVEETGSTQKVDWQRSENLFFNAGPARIPHHHKAILGYCREFGVPLQVIINDNRNAFFHDEASFGGKPVRGHLVKQSMQHHLAELLSKAINKHTLDNELSGLDRERVLNFVRDFGELEKNFTYNGASRAGYSVPRGAGTVYGQVNEPLAMQALTSNNFWLTINYADDYEFAPTMFQPVGGMDRIAKAFSSRVEKMIQYNSVITQIRRSGEQGAEVVYKDRNTGKEKTIAAPYVIVTIPLTVLKDIDADFSPRHKTAIIKGAENYTPATKLAFLSRRRFWEDDEQIYGGISWTSQDITQIWYPSTDFHGKNGIILGAYAWLTETGAKLGKLSPGERIDLALAQGEKLHPAYRKDVTQGVSVAWGNMPFNHGAYCEWTDDYKKEFYPVLAEADGPYIFAGEHVSNISAWQEGAVLAAHMAVKKIAEQVAARKT